MCWKRASSFKTKQNIEHTTTTPSNQAVMHVRYYDRYMEHFNLDIDVFLPYQKKSTIISYVWTREIKATKITPKKTTCLVYSTKNMA